VSAICVSCWSFRLSWHCIGLHCIALHWVRSPPSMWLAVAVGVHALLSTKELSTLLVQIVQAHWRADRGIPSRAICRFLSVARAIGCIVLLWTVYRHHKVLELARSGLLSEDGSQLAATGATVMLVTRICVLVCWWNEVGHTWRDLGEPGPVLTALLKMCVGVSSPVKLKRNWWWT